MRPPGEDVEDKLGTVDDPHLGDIADGLDLRRREVLVENDKVRAELLGADDELLQLAFTEEITRIDVMGPLNDRIQDMDRIGTGELLQLLDGLLLL